VPQGVDTDQLVTILAWDLNPDGAGRAAPVVQQSGITDSNRPQAQRHAENGDPRGAAPHLSLPPILQWHGSMRSSASTGTCPNDFETVLLFSLALLPLGIAAPAYAGQLLPPSAAPAPAASTPAAPHDDGGLTGSVSDDNAWQIWASPSPASPPTVPVPTRPGGQHRRAGPRLARVITAI
jgi:hypothetical protein